VTLFYATANTIGGACVLYLVNLGEPRTIGRKLLNLAGVVYGAACLGVGAVTFGSIALGYPLMPR
jgi:hypothetical protein